METKLLCLESEPWYSIIDGVLPERSREMTRAQGVVFLKQVVVKPFIQHLDWFFALYKDYRVISDVNPSRCAGGKYLPAASVQVWYRRLLIFEYYQRKYNRNGRINNETTL